MSKSEKPEGRRSKGNRPKRHVSKRNSAREEGVEGLILLAEDNEEDVILMRRGFAKANFLNPLAVVPNGEEAIAYLQGEGKYIDRKTYPFPTLLLLDLKLPRKNGFEVLEWIGQQSTMGALRVVVLTSSDDIWDLRQAYQLGAASFLIKPVDFHHFVDLSQSIKGYWLWLTRDPRIGGNIQPFKNRLKSIRPFLRQFQCFLQSGLSIFTRRVSSFPPARTMTRPARDRSRSSHELRSAPPYTSTPSCM